MITRMTRNWWALVGRGLAALCLGITALVWPDLSQSALVYLFGAFSLSYGMMSLAYALTAEPDFRWLFAVEGFVAIAGGDQLDRHLSARPRRTRDRAWPSPAIDLPTPGRRAARRG